MNKKHETVCAIVVTYNRKDLLIECLDALMKQTKPVDAIYIIDNASTDGTPELLKEKGYIHGLPPKELTEPWEKTFYISHLPIHPYTHQSIYPSTHPPIHYVLMHENTGGAGGFHEGVKRAYERGYDWLWLMDDDAEPKVDCLSILSKYFVINEAVGLAPKVVILNNKVDYAHRGILNFDRFPKLQLPIKKEFYNKKIIEIEFSSFVGFLIKREILRSIGFPKKEFFIHHDDIEYCARLKKYGKIFLVSDSIIYHKYYQKRNLLRKTFLGKHSLRCPYNIFWIKYYALRNAVWISMRYSRNKLKVSICILCKFLKEIIRILIYDDHKLKRSFFILSAVWDGLIGKFDNIKPRKILYREKVK